MGKKQEAAPWSEAFRKFLTTLDPEEAMKGTKYEKAFAAGWEAAKQPTKKENVSLEKVAEAIDQAADKWEKDHIESWSGKDPSMVDTGKQDAQDLKRVAQLVRENKLKEARLAGDSLDTIVRDELPRSFYHLYD